MTSENARDPEGLVYQAEERRDMDAEEGRLQETVGQLERLCGRLEQAEQHFKRLTDECETVLQSLVSVDRRHSTAIASLNERLGDWCNLEGKLLEESSRRIERFERGVSHEWMVLRRLNEEPIAELREQAEALRRTCLEAAKLARLRIESAEQNYASHAEEMERRLAEWTGHLLQAGRQPGAADAAEPWSFESVAQLHRDVRNHAPAGAEDTHAVGAAQALPDVPRDATTENPDAVGAQHAVPPQARRRRLGLVAGGIALVALVVFLAASSLNSRRAAASAGAADSTPLEQAEARDDSAAKPGPAAAQVAEQDERLLEAQRAVERAALMVDILAAPDLLRYALAGAGSRSTAYAQVLWSRTRGLAVTASRLPAPPAGSSYQVWIGNDPDIASAGVLTPDASGRASLVVPGPLTLPRLGRIRITLEPEAGSSRPSGELCLTGGPTA